MKKIGFFWLALGLLMGVAAGVAWAEEAWKDLNNQVLQLYQSGKHDQALPLAQKALTKAESDFGRNSPEAALSMNNLALIYKTNGQYAEAAKLYEQSLAKAEKIVGPDSEDLLVPLNNLAMAYEGLGQKDKANKIYDRIRAMGHPQTADIIKKRAQTGR